MLRSYEAIYDHGRMQWLGVQPADEDVRVIVTILPNKAASVLKMPHQPSPKIAGKGKVLGDIVSPVAPLSDWNCESCGRENRSFFRREFLE